MIKEINTIEGNTMSDLSTVIAEHSNSFIEYEDGDEFYNCGCNTEVSEFEALDAGFDDLESWHANHLESKIQEIVTAQLVSAWLSGHSAGWDEHKSNTDSGWVPSGYEQETTNPFLRGSDEN